MIKEIAMRHSVRRYQEKSVEHEKLVELLKAAMQAPSSMNRQEWHFIVLEQAEDVRALCSLSEKEILKTAPACIIVLAKQREVDRELMYVDTAAAIENIHLEAVELGLATCWTVIAPKEERIRDYSRYFGIDTEKYLPMALIPVGYSAEGDKSGVDRYDEKKVIWFEK